jgi:mRNA interferase RelE/StbE
MVYRVEIEPAARRQLRKLPLQAQAQITPVIDALALDPRPSGVVKMEGPEGYYRVRRGHFRIVYSIEHDVLDNGA